MSLPNPAFVPEPQCGPAGLMHIREGSRHLVLHPTRPRWTLVNELGLLVLSLCDGDRSLEEIAQAVAGRYGQPVSRVQRDVLDFMAVLLQSGFLAMRPAAGLDSPEDTGLRTIDISVADTCNLRCAHCAVQGERAGSLSGQEIQRVIDEFVVLGGRAVAITGGEPLTRSDCLALLRYSASRVRTRLLTNATLIGPNEARELADQRVEVQISLDGADAPTHDAIRGTGAFDRAMRGIELLLDHGVGGRTTLCMTLMRHNIAQVEDMIGLAEGLGVAMVRFLPLQPLGAALDCWPELHPAADERHATYRYLYQTVPRHGLGVRLSGGLPGFVLAFGQAKRWCGVGTKLYVDNDGGVYPCDLMTQCRFLLGDVRQQSLAHILASSAWRELVEAVVTREQAIPECRACLWRNFCQGGCPAKVFLQEGSLLATDDICDFRRQLYRDVIFDLADRQAEAARPELEPGC